MGSVPSEGPVYEIGPWRFEVGNGLFRAGQSVHLAPKELDALAVLVESAGRVVTKEELHRRLWPDVAVTDASLSRCIYQLRKALSAGGEADYVETVPRRGYRFVGATRELSAVRGAEEPIRLAVLPFELVGGEPGGAYRTEGLAEEVIARLSRLHGHGLVVLSRHATAHVPGGGADLPRLGRELRLDYVLAGTARAEGESLRLRVELIRVSDLAQVWTEDIVRSQDESGALHARIAAAIANRLPLQLPGSLRREVSRVLPVDLRVYDGWLQARYHWNQRTPQGIGHALALYTRVLGWDPGFAPAHVGVAMAHLTLASWDEVWPLEAAARARPALEMALSLDPDLAIAHAVLGELQGRVEWRFDEAERSFRRALALDPADPDIRYYHALLLLCLGRCEEAVSEVERALERDPYAIGPLLVRVIAHHLARRPEDAIEAARRCIEIQPNFAWGHLHLGITLCELGRVEEARGAVRRGQQLAPKDPTPLAWLAHVEARAGHRAAARKALDEIWTLSATRMVTPSAGAAAAVALGEPDEAFAWLDRAAAQRCPWLPVLLHDPRLDALRGDARFEALDARVRGGAREDASRAARPPA